MWVCMCMYVYVCMYFSCMCRSSSAMGPIRRPTPPVCSPWWAVLMPSELGLNGPGRVVRAYLDAGFDTADAAIEAGKLHLSIVDSGAPPPLPSCTCFAYCAQCGVVVAAM